MENEIVRKTTSLTLIAILVAGGLTFAVPGVIPAAHAAGAMYVSAENDMFENTFAGAQVIEVIVSDDQFRADDRGERSFEPIVTVDDNPLKMMQAQSGNWYGYFVEKSKAMEAHDTGLMNFGPMETERLTESTVLYKFTYAEEDGINDRVTNVLKEPGIGNPDIYAFDFTEGSDIDVELENGANTETVTLTYDTVEDYASLVLDRSQYPQMAHVHITITDTWLNIDPTSEDTWNLSGDGLASYSDAARDSLVNLHDTGLMCDDNCVLLINPDKQNRGTVIEVQSNLDRQVTDDEVESFTIRFEEDAANSGIFTNSDNDDAANVMVTSNAQRGTTATIDYNDSPIDIVIRNSFAEIDIQSDGMWKSGMEIPVIITDDDANLNGASDEDMLVTDPNMIIPTMVTGSPVTLDDKSTYSTGDDYASTNTTTFSKRGILDVPDTNTLVLRFDGQPLNLLEADSAFKGFTYFNYNFETLGDINKVMLTTADSVGSYDCDSANVDEAVSCLVDEGLLSSSEAADVLDFDEISVSLDGVKINGDCNITIASGASGYDNIDDQLKDLDKCNADEDIALVIRGDIQANYKAPVIADFMSFGYADDGIQGTERVANQIVRIEAEETDDGSGVFEGAMEYIMVNQLNILDQATYDGVDPISDAVTFIAMEDLTDEDAPKVTYLDLGADGVETQVSDQEEAPSSSGVVSFDSNNYKIADTVTITLEDQDLNTDSELVDIYTIVRDRSSNIFGQVGDIERYDGFEVTESFGDLGRLLDVTFDDSLWATDSSCANDETGLDATGFTLVETGIATGVFTGDFQIPSTWCDNNREVTTTGLDIEVNYVDFRDGAGEIIEVGDSAAVGANTGTVSLDRTVYPVPFGTPIDARADDERNPNGDSYFPIHSTGFDTRGGQWYIPGGDLTIHIRVSDPDYDVSATGQDTISEAVDGTENTGPVRISVKRGSDIVTLGYVGGPESNNGKIADGLPSELSSDMVKQFGPMQEVAPNTGVFEADITIRYTDGPADSNCPPMYDLTSRIVEGANDNDRFCIMQGDILQVEYTDPLDASGDENTVTDSATFDLRNGVLQADKTSYHIGSDMVLTLIEPDFDLDNDQAETYDLDLIEWDSDAATLTMGNRGGEAAAFDPEPTDFRETGDSTGIFQTVIEIPEELEGDRLERGEAITLEYVDWGPAGANYVGEEDEDVRLDVATSDLGATIELDQKVYTWTDKVYVTIVAPDHNYDSDLVDEIGDSETDPLKISTRGHDLDQYKLVETGPDTGIFTGEVILNGFTPHDADGDGESGDVEGRTYGTGPTGGYLQTTHDDGLSVSFEYSEDEIIVASALVRWNIGEVQWTDSSYPASGSGNVRVIDPDMNLNPEAVDNFDINVWSDSDAGGIDLTVTETNEATGIFEGHVSFTTETESSGHRLRVAEGDTVTAEYEDRTLPDPYNREDDLDIKATTLIGTVVPPLERAPAADLRVVDSSGNSLGTVSVDQQVQITADLMNGQDRDQAFAYLVQVQDGNGVVVSLSWITGSLTPGQSFSPSTSWTPEMAGMYTVTAFIWESLNNPTALSPSVSTTVTVQ